MATHSSILAWRIPWMRSLVGYSPWGHKELDTTEVTVHVSQCRENVRYRKRWQEYTEELYKKDLHDPDNHDAVVNYL